MNSGETRSRRERQILFHLIYTKGSGTAALQKAATDPDPQVRENAVAGVLLFGLRK